MDVYSADINKQSEMGQLESKATENPAEKPATYSSELRRHLDLDLRPTLVSGEDYLAEIAETDGSEEFQFVSYVEEHLPGPSSFSTIKAAASAGKENGVCSEPAKTQPATNVNPPVSKPITNGTPAVVNSESPSAAGILLENKTYRGRVVAITKTNFSVEVDGARVVVFNLRFYPALGKTKVPCSDFVSIGDFVELVVVPRKPSKTLPERWAAKFCWIGKRPETFPEEQAFAQGPKEALQKQQLAGPVQMVASMPQQVQKPHVVPKQQAAPKPQAAPKQQGVPKQQVPPKPQTAPKQQVVPQQQAAPKQQVVPKQQAAPKPQAAPKQQGVPKQQAAPKPQAAPKQQGVPKQQAAPKPQAAPKQQVVPKQQAAPKPQTAPKQQVVPQQQAAPKQQVVPKQQAAPKPQAVQKPQVVPQQKAVPKQQTAQGGNSATVGVDLALRKNIVYAGVVVAVSKTAFVALVNDIRVVVYSQYFEPTYNQHFESCTSHVCHGDVVHLTVVPRLPSVSFRERWAAEFCWVPKVTTSGAASLLPLLPPKFPLPVLKNTSASTTTVPKAPLAKETVPKAPVAHVPTASSTKKSTPKSVKVARVEETWLMLDGGVSLSTDNLRLYEFPLTACNNLMQLLRKGDAVWVMPGAEGKVIGWLGAPPDTSPIEASSPGAMPSSNSETGLLAFLTTRDIERNLIMDILNSVPRPPVAYEDWEAKGNFSEDELEFLYEPSTSANGKATGKGKKNKQTAQSTAANPAPVKPVTMTPAPANPTPVNLQNGNPAAVRSVAVGAERPLVTSRQTQTDGNVCCTCNGLRNSSPLYHDPLTLWQQVLYDAEWKS